MRWTGKRDEIRSDPKLKGHGVYVFVVFFPFWPSYIHEPLCCLSSSRTVHNNEHRKFNVMWSLISMGRRCCFLITVNVIYFSYIHSAFERLDLCLTFVTQAKG